MSDLDREIAMGEIRLRYIQLMRDAQRIIGADDAIELIKDSERIWKNLLQK